MRKLFVAILDEYINIYIYLYIYYNFPIYLYFICIHIYTYIFLERISPNKTEVGRKDKPSSYGSLSSRAPTVNRARCECVLTPINNPQLYEY